MSKGWRKNLTAAVLAGLLLSGCGDKGADAVSEEAPKTSETPAAVEAEAPAAEVGEASDEASWIEQAIGTTEFRYSVPADYYGADVTEEERRDDMIAYYKSDAHLMDFDVYQFGKDGKTLAEYTDEESKQYGADSFETLSINGIEVTRYYSDETYDGIDYRVANYIFEGESDFGELAFWLDGEDAQALVDRIMATLTKTDSSFYDMYGTVVGKGEDPFTYNVKGDNDEIFVCNYNGIDELQEGTPVGMIQIGDGWTVEPLDKDGTSEEAVITDENGVTVTGMSLQINTPETCVFEFSLNTGDILYKIVLTLCRRVSIIVIGDDFSPST